MTTRTFFYLFVVSLSVAVLAVTGSSEVLAEAPKPVLGVVARVDAPRVEETSGRWGMLLVGIGLVLASYRQAYLNFRR